MQQHNKYNKQGKEHNERIGTSQDEPAQQELLINVSLQQPF